MWAIAFTGVALLTGYRRKPSAPDPVSAPAGRGLTDNGKRLSATPPAIPAAGWKDVLTRLYGRLGEDRILVIAAGITFYNLLALFPAIAALVSIYGMFADPGDVARLVGNMSTVLPGGAIDVIRSQITRVASHGSTTLGIATIIALAVSLWSANAGMKALFDGLNVAFRQRETRSFITLNLVSLCFTIGMIVFALLSLAAIVVVPYLVKGSGDAGGWVIAIGQWPVLLILVSLAFACLYRFGPSRDTSRWRWLTWGSAVASVIWLAASILFSWYAANFGTYNKTYGSLGAIIGFMTWMWISTIVLMLGGMLNAELEHRRAEAKGGSRS